MGVADRARERIGRVGAGITCELKQPLDHILHLLLGGVASGSFVARSWAISVYGSPEAQTEWEAWRAGAEKLSTTGPVKRRVPKSDKPPALILATTYFGICLTIVLLLSTVLFATAVYFVQGVLRSPGGMRKEGKPQSTS